MRAFRAGLPVPVSYTHLDVYKRQGYTFIGLPELLADFSSDIERWNHENDHL